MNLFSNWGLKINPAGNLSWEDIDLSKVAKQVGTPCHIINERLLRNNARFFISMLRENYPSCSFFYSFKTNCIPIVIKILQEEGFGAEVVSDYELWLALRLGFPSKKIIVNGIGKDLQMMERAINNGVKLINIDSMQEIEFLEELCQNKKKKISVLLRLNLSFNSWRNLIPKNQFGIDELMISKAVEKICSSKWLILRGMHFHCGTNMQSLHIYKRSIRKALGYFCRYEEKIKDPILDIGGGFPSSNTRKFRTWELLLMHLFKYEPPSRLSLSKCSKLFLQNLIQYFKKEMDRLDLNDLELFLEPGRVIVESSQLMLIGIRDVKRNKGIRYAISDGGAYSNAFWCKYEYHNLLRVNNYMANESKKDYCITGRLCTLGDILYKKKKLPKLKKGDVLALMDTGAYFTSFSNNFSFPRPNIYLIKLGKKKIIPLWIESSEDIIKSDTIDLK